MEIVTDKVKVLTAKEVSKVRTAYLANGQQEKAINKVRDILGLESGKAYHVGTSAATIANPVKYGVYRHVWKGRKLVYVVMNPIDEKLAYCLTFTPQIGIVGKSAGNVIIDEPLGKAR